MGKFLIALGVLGVSLSVSAKGLICETEKDWMTFQLTAQVTEKDQVVDMELWSHDTTATFIADKEVFKNEGIDDGRKTSRYIKFGGADLTCNYIITFPQGFSAKTEFVGYFDSYCEDHGVRSRDIKCLVF